MKRVGSNLPGFPGRIGAFVDNGQNKIFQPSRTEMVGHPKFSGLSRGALGALVCLLLGTHSICAGESGAAFLNQNPSVRSQALGDVSLAAQGAQAIGINPAMIGPVSSKGEVDTSYFQSWEESSNARLAYAHNLNYRHAWGLSVAASDSGDSQSTDSFGQTTGRTASSQNGTLTGAFAGQIRRGVRLGAAGRVFQSTLADEKTAVSWSADVGMTAQSKKFLVGVCATQLGPGLKHINQKDPLPGVVHIGGTWNTGPISLMGGYQIPLVDEGSQGALALEYRLKILALRMGYKNQFGGKNDSATSNNSGADSLFENLTLGFGLSLPRNFKMDYAFRQTNPDWGPSHSAALSWAWGARPLPPKPQKKWAPPNAAKPTPPARRPPAPRQKLKK